MNLSLPFRTAIAIAVGVTGVTFTFIYMLTPKTEKKEYSLAAAKAAAPKPVKKSTVKTVDMGAVMEGVSVTEIRIHELTTLRDSFPSANIRNDRCIGNCMHTKDF
jgi:hypothetical protein